MPEVYILFIVAIFMPRPFYHKKTTQFFPEWFVNPLISNKIGWQILIIPKDIIGRGFLQLYVDFSYILGMESQVQVIKKNFERILALR